jgi:3-oxoacyl-[acyl-carrier protein] reductase
MRLSQDKTSAERRIVLVTGGRRGIGYALAEAFLREGCEVVICGRALEKLHDARKCLSVVSESIYAMPADVTDPEQVSHLAEWMKARFDRLDVLVNNVGNFVLAPVLKHTWKQWREILDSNLSSVFLTCKALAPLLEKSSAGRVVNVGASYASISRGFPGYGPFAAAKAALLSLSRTLSLELSPKGITVNVVSPGLIDTGAYERETMERWRGLIPVGRFGRPEEVARAAVFLAAAESAYITGSEIIVGGGWEGDTPDE